MNPNFIEISATLCFALALIHTFSVGYFLRLAERWPKGSSAENLFHLLGEVEVVFGLWAAIFTVLRVLIEGAGPAIQFLETLNFTEPVFVFVILSLCSTRPILWLGEALIDSLSRLLPLNPSLSFFVVTLILGPLLGSLITEPAAMTVTALILLQRFYRSPLSESLKYATLGLLFVNVSVGGTLTHFAAPPILMVAPTWNWDTPFMLATFGWRGALACVLSTLAVALYFRREIASLPPLKSNGSVRQPPMWLVTTHLLFLGAVVIGAHHMVVFVALFLFFVGLVHVTKEHQSQIKIREGLLVGFFLGGLVVLGQPQRWWLEPLLNYAGPNLLFWGATSLTAITDNAALTYLGAQVPNLSDLSKIALVSGAVVGGGLTVVANAPNPAGYGILNSAFPNGGIKPLGLLVAALPPTLIAAICFWLI